MFTSMTVKRVYVVLLPPGAISKHSTLVRMVKIYKRWRLLTLLHHKLFSRVSFIPYTKCSENDETPNQKELVYSNKQTDNMI